MPLKGWRWGSTAKRGHRLAAINRQSRACETLQVFGDLLEGFKWRSLAFGKSTHGVFKAVIDMILDQRAFRLTYRFLDGMKLLSNVHAFAAVFDHGDDASQVAVCTLETFDDRLV